MTTHLAILPFLAAFLAPVALAAAMVAPAARPLVWRMIPLAPVPALLLALTAPLPSVATDDWLLMGATMGLTPTGRLFLIFTALVWAAAGAAARQWLREDPRGTGFGLFFLLAQSGNLGLILAQDAAGFYGAFAMMSFASYGLVIHSRGPQALAAARLYIGFVIGGELALFAGLALAVGQAGSLLLADLRASAMPDAAAALILLGLGAKLGVMPLHFWLPPAHGAAPVPASAVLSGTMIKAGLYGMIVILPLGHMPLPDHGTAVIAAGLVTIFAAVLLGVQQDSPKAVLGFSSVSQMGIIALGLGTGLAAPQAWPAILPVVTFLAAHHALAKGALFLGTGAFAAQPRRAGRALLTVLLLLPVLVLAGLPGTSGSLGKEALKAALGQGAGVWLPWLTLALTLSGMATTLLMARFAAMIWLHPPGAPPGASDRPEALALPFVALAVAAAVLPLLWPMTAGTVAAPIQAAKSGALWPLLLGVLVAAVVAVQAHARRIGPAVLAGQLAAPPLWLLDRAQTALAARRRAFRRQARAIPARIAAEALEWRLTQTAIAGLIAVILLIEGTAALRYDPLAPRDATGPAPDPAAATVAPGDLPLGPEMSETSEPARAAPGPLPRAD